MHVLIPYHLEFHILTRPKLPVYIERLDRGAMCAGRERPEGAVRRAIKRGYRPPIDQNRQPRDVVAAACLNCHPLPIARHAGADREHGAGGRGKDAGSPEEWGA